MALWTTYLAFLTRNKKEIFRKLKCTSKSHAAIIKYVMRNRGNNEVAPHKELLAEAKSGKISWEQYTRDYLEQIQFSEEAHDWMSDMATDAEDNEVILVCFEKDAEHCHRTLLAQEIKREFPEIEFKGELSSLFPFLG